MSVVMLSRELERERAKAAHDAVMGCIPDKHEKFLSYARKAPTMLITCGLGQTCAFLAVKEEEVFKALAGWLKEKRYVESEGPKALGDIVRMDVSRYRLAEREALAFLGWLKRLSEVYLSSNGGADEG
jgi:CRISPR-associated protein Cmr5